jgi:hypothetical protein
MKLLWTNKEDKLLKKIMQKEKEAVWSVIAASFNESSGTKKTGRQCRERWRNHLDPEIKKYTSRFTNREKWTDEEDVILLEAELKYGKKWVEIKKKLKGRSENSIKNRYNTLYKKYLDKNKIPNVEDVNEALQAVTKDKVDGREWVRTLIEQKKSKCIV